MEKSIFNAKDFHDLVKLSEKDSYSTYEAKKWIKELSLINTLFYSNSNSSSDSIPDHLKIFCPSEEDRKNLVLFPGTFSPWHQGHEACVLGLGDRPVLIMPDFNPWKEEREADLWQDLLRVIRFVQKHPEKPISVYPGFMILEHANPTVNWLPGLSLKKKELLMGDDTFLSIHRWRDAKKLLNTVDVIHVCPRKGRKKELKKQADFLFESFGVVIEFLPEHSFQEVSSTAIRDDLSKSE